MATGRLFGRIKIPVQFAHPEIKAADVSGLYGTVAGRLEADGRYSFDALLPGRYRLMLSFHGFGCSATGLVFGPRAGEVKAGEALRLDLDYPGQTLVLRLRDERGRPVSHGIARCWVRRAAEGGGYAAYHLSDADGVIRLGHVPKGCLSVSLDGRDHAPVDVTPPWSPPRAEMEVRIVPAKVGGK